MVEGCSDQKASTGAEYVDRYALGPQLKSDVVRSYNQCEMSKSGSGTESPKVFVGVSTGVSEGAGSNLTLTDAYLAVDTAMVYNTNNAA